MEHLTSRLQSLPAHISLFLLRNSLAIPRLMYLLRASPSYKCPNILKNIDDLIRSALCDITNISIDDVSWLQASLPIRSGGLGIRSSGGLAIPAYLASTHSVSDLVLSLLPEVFRISANNDLQDALSIWKTSTALDPPLQEKKHIQKSWDAPFIQQTIDLLFKKTSSLQDKARL